MSDGEPLLYQRYHPRRIAALIGIPAQVVEAIQEVLRKRGNLLLVGPTGSGKTCIIDAIAQEMGLGVIDLETDSTHSLAHQHKAVKKAIAAGGYFCMDGSWKPTVVRIDNIDAFCAKPSDSLHAADASAAVAMAAASSAPSSAAARTPKKRARTISTSSPTSAKASQAMQKFITAVLAKPRKGSALVLVADDYKYAEVRALRDAVTAEGTHIFTVVQLFRHPADKMDAILLNVLRNEKRSLSSGQRKALIDHAYGDPRSMLMQLQFSPPSVVPRPRALPEVEDPELVSYARQFHNIFEMTYGLFNVKLKGREGLPLHVRRGIAALDTRLPAMVHHNLYIEPSPTRVHTEDLAAMADFMSDAALLENSTWRSPVLQELHTELVCCHAPYLRSRARDARGVRCKGFLPLQRHQGKISYTDTFHQNRAVRDSKAKLSRLSTMTRAFSPSELRKELWQYFSIHGNATSNPKIHLKRGILDGFVAWTLPQKAEDYTREVRATVETTMTGLVSASMITKYRQKVLEWKSKPAS